MYLNGHTSILYLRQVDILFIHFPYSSPYFQESAKTKAAMENVEQEKHSITKNVLILCFSVMLIFAAFKSMSALQSSNNKVLYQMLYFQFSQYCHCNDLFRALSTALRVMIFLLFRLMGSVHGLTPLYMLHQQYPVCSCQVMLSKLLL